MPTSPSTPRFPTSSLPPSTLAELADAEIAVHNTIDPNIQLKDSSGNLLGPFGPLAYTPSTLPPYLAFATAINTTPHLSTRERELVVLATTSVTKSAYIAYAHSKAGAAAGLSEEQVDAASRGCDAGEVGGLSEREGVVYSLGLEMTRGFGRLGDEAFEGAVGVLGREGVSAVAQVVGAYFLGAVLVEVGGAEVPSE